MRRLTNNPYVYEFVCTVRKKRAKSDSSTTEKNLSSNSRTALARRRRHRDANDGGGGGADGRSRERRPPRRPNAGLATAPARTTAAMASSAVATIATIYSGDRVDVVARGRRAPPSRTAASARLGNEPRRIVVANAWARGAALTRRRRVRGVAPRASEEDDSAAPPTTSTSSSSSAEPELECVVVGMEAACVLSVDDDDDDDGESGGDASSTSSVARVGVGDDDDADAATGFAALLGGAALVSPFFLWGTSMVAMKTVLPATSPLFVASVRLVPAGAVLIAWAALNKRPWPNTANAWAAIALFGLVDGTMFQGFLSEGLQRTSAGLGSVIIDSQPLTVAVLASVIYGETIGAGGVFGLFLGVVGLLMLELPREALEGLFHGDAATAIAAITSGVDAEGGLWESGEWWMLLAAQSMAVGTVMVRWVCKYVDPVMATGWHMALGGVPLLAYSVINEPEVYSRLGELTGNEVGGLVYTSMLGSALAYGAFFYFASRGSLTKLSSLTFLTPMFAALFGYILLGETLDEVQLAGALVTVVGIYLVNTRASEGAASEKN